MVLLKQLFINAEFRKGCCKSNFKTKKMTAKNYLRMASLALFITIASPASSAAIVPESITPTEDVRSQQLLQRLEEIKGLDKSEMSRLEKKSLRKEVKEIKKEMKALSGGVYLSVGAIIIIILLLILIL